MRPFDKRTYLAHVRTLLHPGARVLDVGCGTGADVYDLFEAGFDAHGIDKSEDAISEGRQRYNLTADVLRVDSLPDLRITNSEFDLVLCANVLQSIRDQDLLDTVYRLRSLVAAGGFLVLVIPSPKDVRQSPNDLVTTKQKWFRPADQYTFFFQRLGLHEIVSYSEDFSSDPNSLRAQVMVYSARDSSDLKPIETIESVLWDDRKVNTYKFALIRALARIAGNRPKTAKWHDDGTVSVDIDAIASLWLEYYWPLVGNRTTGTILQGPLGAKADMGFRPDLASIAMEWEPSGGLSGFKIDRDGARLSPDQERKLKNVMRKLAAAIKQPVRYAGNDRTGKNLFTYSNNQVSLPAAIWTELSLMSRWIEDSVMIRWAEFTEGLRHQNPDATAAAVLALLLEQTNDTRDTNVARTVFLSAAKTETLECVWTGKTVTTFDVDHAIPWALWRNNDLWNLFPVDPRINNAKRARIPSRERVVSRRTAIEHAWDTLFEHYPTLFLAHASKFTGSELNDFAVVERNELFGTFKDALEFTAINRGVERW